MGTTSCGPSVRLASRSTSTFSTSTSQLFAMPLPLNPTGRGDASKAGNEGVGGGAGCSVRRNTSRMHRDAFRTFVCSLHVGSTLVHCNFVIVSQSHTVVLEGARMCHSESLFARVGTGRCLASVRTAPAVCCCRPWRRAISMSKLDHPPALPPGREAQEATLTTSGILHSDPWGL